MMASSMTTEAVNGVWLEVEGWRLRLHEEEPKEKVDDAVEVLRECDETSSGTADGDRVESGDRLHSAARCLRSWSRRSSRFMRR
jgi:hypothetical protein